MAIRFVLFIMALTAYCPAADTLRVLWLGNSLITSTYSRTDEISRCGQQLGVPIYNKYGTYMYDATWGWTNTPDNKTLISSGNWDYVVIQVFGTSGCALESYDAYNIDVMKNAIRMWDSLVDAASAKTIFYMPWGTDGYKPAYDSVAHAWKHPDRMDTMITHLTGICQQRGAWCFPVAPAQWEVQKRYPAVPLFLDWIHGSAEAGYLGGLTCFAALTGMDIRNITNFYSLDATVAANLRQIAWETVNRSEFQPYEHMQAKIESPWVAREAAELVAYPNPFSSGVNFRLPRAEIRIVDVTGRQIRLLKKAAWDGLDEKGAPVKAGVYFASAGKTSVFLLKIR